MSLKSKFILTGLISLVMAAVGLWLAASTVAFSPRVSDRDKKMYAGLVSQQIYNRWQCLAKDQKEQFIFSLMEQYTPKDKKTLTTGRIRKQELEHKNEAGQLTVAEREELNSGFYEHPTTDFWEKQSQELDRYNGNFSKPSCVAKERAVFLMPMPEAKIADYCKPPHMRVRLDGENLEVIYEDKYSRWTLPRSALEAELEKLSWLDRATAKQKLMETAIRLHALKAQAEANVSRLPAEQVAVGTEEVHIETEYRRLICAETDVFR